MCHIRHTASPFPLDGGGCGWGCPPHQRGRDLYLYQFDESQEIARAYGAERTPEVFVFDKQSQVRYHGAIDDNYDDPSAVKLPYLRAALGAVLGGKGPSILATQPAGCTIKWK